MSPEHPKVAVLGAGVAGLAAARRLHDAGHPVVVFEKSRGTGGRTSTRRSDDLSFDHGAQFVTGQRPQFSGALERWEEQGVVARWSPRMATLDGSPTWRPESTWYVGVPGMNAIARNLAEGLRVHYRTRVERVERTDRGWSLIADSGESYEDFDLLVMALPLPQTASLVEGLGVPSPIACRNRVRPCWSVMVAFERPLDVPFDVATSESGPITWTARNSSKPGRPTPDTWVLHASHEWSREQLDLDPEEASRILLRAWSAALGHELPPIEHLDGHLWRYALPEPRAGRCIQTHGELGLVVAGDGLSTGRVESAYESGIEAAAHLMRVRPLPARW